MSASSRLALIILATGLRTLAQAPKAAEIQWAHDTEAAFKTAATEKKPILFVIMKDKEIACKRMLENVYTQGWLVDQWNIPGYRVAAKTGTAQVPDGNGGYLSGYLVSVSGFAPADDPQFVVSVSIMNPVKMNSSAASAPVFQQVMSQVLKKYRTVPSGAPAPELPATW